MSGLEVAGVDSSTQQTKLVIVDALSGALINSSALPHPDGTDIDPRHWWTAFEGAGGMRHNAVSALSVAAQQHTSIFIDEQGEPVRNAILWNDLRAMASADELVAERGEDSWLELTGLIPDSAHPVSKLRWLATRHPDIAERVQWSMLPHEWLTWRVLGAKNPPTTDRADASSTGYWSPSSGTYRSDLVVQALGRPVQLPRILEPGTPSGTSPTGALIGSGTGDNAATHLALDTEPGDVVISVGTSATVSMRNERPVRDRHGYIDTMADARAGFIPIIAMLNGARVLTSTARMLGVSLDHLDALAAAAPDDAAGLTVLPFLDGERNPRRPRSDGRFASISRMSLTPRNIARAAMLGLGCATANAVDAIVEECGPARRIFLVGGGSRSHTFRQLLADLISAPVRVPRDREHAAFEAARQAAWTLFGSLPTWPECPSEVVDPRAGNWVDDTRAAYNVQLAR